MHLCKNFEFWCRESFTGMLNLGISFFPKRWTKATLLTSTLPRLSFLSCCCFLHEFRLQCFNLNVIWLIVVFSFQDLKQKHNIGSKLQICSSPAYSFKTGRQKWLILWLLSLETHNFHKILLGAYLTTQLQIDLRQQANILSSQNKRNTFFLLLHAS